VKISFISFNIIMLCYKQNPIRKEENNLNNFSFVKTLKKSTNRI